MAKIDGGIGSGGIGGFIIHPCVSEISAFNMSLSKDNLIKSLKEETREIELLLQEDMLSPLPCAMEVARRRKIETIQAIGLSSDQVKEVAMGMKSYVGLKELDLGSGTLGHVGHSPISLVPPQLFRSAFSQL